MDPTDLINYANAIKKIESSGNYGSIGPATRSGDRAYGAYQVMGNNIPSWTQKHYGRSLSPQEFLQNKEAQDAVFNGEFGGAVQKYGNPQDAASVWFSGRPMAKAGNSDDGYITTPEYVNRFNKALSVSPTGDGVTAINQAMGNQPAPSSSPALAFSGDAASGSGATAPAKDDDSTGGVLFQGEKPNKLMGLGSMLANAGAAIAGISNPSAGSNLRAIAQGIQAQAGGKYQYQMGANGQLIRINKDDGTVDSRSIPGAQKGNYHPIMGKDGNGNPVVIGRWDPDSGQPTYFAKQGQQQQDGPQVGGDPSLTGDQRYDSLDPKSKNYVDQWEAGNIGPPSAWQLKNDPNVRAAYDAAQAIGIDFSKFPERTQFAKGYASKNAASLGGQLLRTITAMKQIGDVGDNYLALNNSAGLNPGGWGSAVTSEAANAWANNSPLRSAQRDAIINNLKNNAQTASTEVQTVLSQGKSAEGERSQRQATYLQPNASPLVHAGILETEREQLTNRYHDALEAAKTTMGSRWLEKRPEIDREYQKQYDRVTKQIETLKARGNGTAKEDGTAPQPAANNGSLPKGVTSIQVIQP